MTTELTAADLRAALARTKLRLAEVVREMETPYDTAYCYLQGSRTMPDTFPAAFLNALVLAGNVKAAQIRADADAKAREVEASLPVLDSLLGVAA